MGYGREMMEDAMVDEYAREAIMQYRLRNRLWTMADDSTVELSKMSDRHVKNAYDLLKRRNTEMSEMWLPVLEEELEKRKLRKSDEERIATLERKVSRLEKAVDKILEREE